MVMVVLIVCLFCVGKVSADTTNNIETGSLLFELNIIDETYFSNTNTVTREECLIAIMRAIGVTGIEFDSIDGADFYGFADTPFLSYFGCAYLSKIAYGEERVIDYSTYRTDHTGRNVDYFFFPKRAVTVKEALAFMIRCLEQSDNESLEYAMKRAEEYGLINCNDDFVNKGDSELNQNDFCVLLERFLHKNRYKYYDGTKDGFRMDGYVDEARSVTYLNQWGRQTVE